MKRFDRHIIRRLLTAYVFFVLSLIVFFVVLHYVEYVDDFFDRGATMREVFLVYYPSYVPEVVRLTSPLALFLSVIYLTGTLAQELQLTALQTSGVSLYRLMVPYLLVALLVTGLMFWFNGWIVPQTNQTVLEFDRRYLKNAAEQMDVSQIHRQNTRSGILTVGYYDEKAQIGHRISLQRFQGGQRLKSRVDAQRMQWIDSLDVWRLHQAVVRTFSPQGSISQHEVMQLDTTLQIYPRDLARTESDVQSMTIPVADDYVSALKRSGADQLGRTLVSYYTKYSYPFANLIVVLLGVPMAAVRRRGGQAMQFGIGLAVAFTYLAIMKLTEPFGYAGELSPVLTAWLPHLIFFAAALTLLVRVRK